jgi:hypothetical protein
MAETPAAPTGAFIIEALFRPTTRFRDSPSNLNLPEGFTEVELLPGLTVEDVLATGVTWEDFCRFLQGKIVWMAPGVYISSLDFNGGSDTWVLVLGVPGGASMFVHVTRGTAAAAATATCDFLMRLLATCENHDVYINGCFGEVTPPLSGAGLSLFFQESRDSLRQVTLCHMALDADQCLALATMSRLDVELRIHNCKLADDAAGAFVECLKSDRGPVKLICCEIDSQTIAHALTGNSRVTTLKLDSRRTNDAGMALLVAALANNRGLVDLNLFNKNISDDNWTILCQSLQAHPTLTNLDLRNTRPRIRIVGIRLTADQKAHRTRLLAEMMRHNTILHTIALRENERDEQIYTESILPYLKTNRYRQRVHAIKKADVALRGPLLGRALQTEPVRNDSNLRWMFLSGNPDVVA